MGGAVGEGDGGMGNYFNRLYAPFPPLSAREILWYPQVAESLFAEWFGVQSAFFMMFLSVCGLVVMVRRRIWLAALCFAPPVIALILSVLQVYPLMARLMLYMVPILILTAAFAVDRLMSEAKVIIPALVAGAVLFISYGSLSNIFYDRMFAPHTATVDLSREMATLSREVAENDVILLSKWALPSYLLYRHQYGLEDQRWAIVERALCLDEGAIDFLDTDKIWLVEPFRAWQHMDRRLKIAPVSQADSTVSYAPDRLIAGLAWLRENDLEIDPADPYDCTSVRELDAFLRGGIAPIQLGSYFSTNTE